MKKVMRKIKNFFANLLITVSILVAVLSVFSLLTFDNARANLFGFKFFIVTSDSMKATDFAAGDLIISKNVDVSTLKEGDIITYISTDPNSNGNIITHKIREVRPNGNLYQFVTYGTTTGVNDSKPVEGVNVLGKYVFSIAKVGLVFNFLKNSPAGYVCFIAVPFAIVFLIELINTIRLFRAYKKEEQSQLEAKEKELAERERKQNEEIEKAKKAEREAIEKEYEAKISEMVKKQLENMNSQNSSDSDNADAKDEDESE